MELVVFIWIVCGVISGAIASGKNRSFIGFFLLGILFGPFGILAAVVTSKEE